MNWNADFGELEIGSRFVTAARDVDERDVLTFAALTGDHHPQHVDTYWAARSPFGERIAHGMLVMSFAVGLVPFDPERVVALRRVGDVVFKRPVRLGDRIHVVGEITELKDLDGPAGVVAFSWRVLNSKGETCCRATVEVLWNRAVEDDDIFAPTATGFIPLPL